MIAAIITLSILEILTIIIMLAGYERMLVITARLNRHADRIKELEKVRKWKNSRNFMKKSEAFKN